MANLNIDGTLEAKNITKAGEPVLTQSDLDGVEFSNLVDLTSAQIITGEKTFTDVNAATINATTLNVTTINLV